MVLAARSQLRQCPLRIAAVPGVPFRTTANRYERERPGESVSIDVKKLGLIPDGGGWLAHGRSEQVRGRGIGFD